MRILSENKVRVNRLDEILKVIRPCQVADYEQRSTYRVRGSSFPLSLTTRVLLDITVGTQNSIRSTCYPEPP
jgi:hypothetical protein